MARNVTKRTGKKQPSKRNFRAKDTNKRIEDLKSDRDLEKSGNDPSWYASNPVILKDAASFPFSYCTGATAVHDVTVWQNSNIAHGPVEQIPGVCSLHVYPSVGTSNAPTDPINVAAQSVYSFVRHANSGHSNYDYPDLMMYILAMANMYSFLVWCQRLYGYALTYDQRNRYLPKDLVRTNNVDIDSLIDNLANFRFWINTLIAKMVSFAVPATMSIFSRMSFIYSDYYIEGTSIKEQVYQYVPEGFYKFGIDSNQLGNLTWEAFDYSTLMSVNDVITYGNDLFDAIWSQEDFGIMSGDILKAYGANIIKLSQIPEYYQIVPKFDAMVLTQMKNADMVRLDPARIAQSATAGTILQTLTPRSFSSADIYVGTSQAMGGEASKFNGAMVCAIKDYSVLTVDTDDPTPEVVIEASRLKVGYDAYKGWYRCGTELIVKAVVTAEPGSDIIYEPYIATLSGASVDTATVKYVDDMLSIARNFHYMPRLYVFCTDSNNSNKIEVSCHLDVDNFTVLTFEDIRKLHEAATINMFAVPSIGKVQ